MPGVWDHNTRIDRPVLKYEGRFLAVLAGDKGPETTSPGHLEIAFETHATPFHVSTPSITEKTGDRRNVTSFECVELE